MKFSSCKEKYYVNCVKTVVDIAIADCYHCSPVRYRIKYMCGKNMKANPRGFPVASISR